jgi:hypothetical protein
MTDELLPPFSKSYGAQIVRDYRAKQSLGKVKRFLSKLFSKVAVWFVFVFTVAGGFCAAYDASVLIR